MRCRCCESRRVRDAARGRGGRHWGDVVWLLRRGWLWSLRGAGMLGFPWSSSCVCSLLVGGVDLGGAQIIRYPHAQGFLPQPSGIPYATLWRFCSLVVLVVNAGRVTRGGSDGPPKFWSRAQARQRDCRLLHPPPRHPERPRQRHRNARSAEVTRPGLLPVNMHSLGPPNDSLPPPAEHFHTPPAPLETNSTPGDKPSSPKECLDCDDDDSNRG